MHSYYHTHVDGTRHKHSHPPKNQAHYGKPGADEMMRVSKIEGN